MQDLFTKEFMRQINDEFDLRNFLHLAAPDRNAGFYYHDKDDKPIDCNIYHPKYGYRGFVADSKDIIPSFNECTIYQEDKTGKQVYCRYHLQMLCEYEDGKFSNKDGAEVVKVEAIFSSQTRIVAGDADFAEIYNREWIRKGLTDKPANLQPVFIKELREHVEKLIERHRGATKYDGNLQIEWIDLAGRFLAYLDKLEGTRGVLPHAENALLTNDSIESLPTKQETLTRNLKQYGFFELLKCITLDEARRENFIRMLSEKHLPYQIAMLDHLGFIQHLHAQHFITKAALYKELAKILSAQCRAVRGNYLVLQPKSREDKIRYTAHKHMHEVEKDYPKNKA